MIACRILDSRYALKQGKVDIKNSTSKFNSYSGRHPRRLFVYEAPDFTGSKTECNRPGGQKVPRSIDGNRTLPSASGNNTRQVYIYLCNMDTGHNRRVADLSCNREYKT